jgi:hypothetical protein
MPENISGVPAGRSVFHLTSPLIGLLASVVERPSQAIRLKAGSVVLKAISTLSGSCIANLKRGSEAHD